MAKSTQLYMVIGNTSLAVTHEVVPLKSVSLDAQNPRIRFLVQRRFGKKKPTAEELLDLIREQPGYDGLQKAIRKTGGLHDPVIVRHDGTLVEGNSRVAVFKTLHKGNRSDQRWKAIPIVRLPKNTPENLVGLLMASYHVAGKTVWRPYAQADHIYQLRQIYKCSLEEIADEVRMTTREVQQYIDAYEYLVNEVLPKVANGDGADVLEGKFSHALEFMKLKKLESHRKDPEKRAHMAKLLVENKIKGAEVRELHGIFESEKATQALKERGFKHAKEVLRATNPIAGSQILKKVESVTKALNKLSQKDLTMFKTEAKAAQILIDLHDAVRNVASVASMKLGARNA